MNIRQPLPGNLNSVRETTNRLVCNFAGFGGKAADGTTECTLEEA